ncbi:MAG TPA: class I SAM-dependent methyltransferase [Nevskiaceae bacterium]|nr:class I SAM-dependent methyltransferase [Nevskiaceae bacterium]
MCPVCGNRKVKTQIEGYFKCANCLSLYSKRVPTELEIQKRIDYYGKPAANSSIDWKLIKVHKNRVIYLSRFLSKNKSLLDVGCGRGTFLKCAQDAGFKIWGVDKSKKFIEFVKKMGVEAFNSLSEVKDESFDCVTSFDVIEHTFNPKTFILEIKRKLKKRGILMMTTPNSEGISAKILKGRWWVLNPEDHYVIFNPSSLQLLLKNNGFKIIETKTDTLTQWFIANKNLMERMTNKIIYLFFKPFLKYLFSETLGDNIQIVAVKQK